MEEIKITTPFITLGQLLKLTNKFESGGMIKGYLAEEGAFVNGELDKRRGRKVYLNDIVKLTTGETYIVKGK